MSTSLRKRYQQASPDQVKAVAAAGICIGAILSIIVAAAVDDWSKWCSVDKAVCEITGLWEECSDNFGSQYLCTDTSGKQYGAVRAFVVLSVPAALACIYMAYKVAKKPVEIDYFRFLWYACGISEVLFGMVAMILYMSITISAGEPHVRYGPGFAFLIVAWILAVGNVLCAASIGPGGLAGVCGRRVRRGADLLTADERTDGEFDNNSMVLSPRGNSARQLSLDVPSIMGGRSERPMSVDVRAVSVDNASQHQPSRGPLRPLDDPHK